MSCGSWKTARFSLGSESDVRQWTGRCPEARSVPQGPAVSLFRMRPAKVAVGSFQSYFSKGFGKQRMRTFVSRGMWKQLGPCRVGPGPPGNWFRPVARGPVRPSGPCCLAVVACRRRHKVGASRAAFAEGLQKSSSDAPFVSFAGGWKTARFSCRVRK